MISKKQSSSHEFGKRADVRVGRVPLATRMRRFMNSLKNGRMSKLRGKMNHGN